MSTGSITATSSRGLTLVRLQGTIGTALRPQASAARALSLARRLPILVDASAVTGIDGAGIAFLIQCSRLGHAEGLTVTLRASPCVAEPLQVLDDGRLFDRPEAAGDERALDEQRSRGEPTEAGPKEE